MADAYEQKVIIGYLQNLLEVGRLSLAALEELCRHFDGVLSFLDLHDENENLLDLLDDFRRAAQRREGVRSVVRSVREGMLEVLEEGRIALKKVPPGSMERNIRQLIAELQLDEDEGALLALLLRYRGHLFFYELLNALGHSNMGVAEILAACLGIDDRQVRRLLASDGRLLASGVLIQETRNGSDIDDHYDLPEVIQNAFRQAMSSDADVRAYLLGEPAVASLDWQDYEHIAPARDRLGLFLKQAVAQRLVGVNVLLYGPPGTGKTEFCKTLASWLGFKLYALTEKDEDGKEPNRKERISGFQLSQNLLRFQHHSLLLFDEMDDLFGPSDLASLFGDRCRSGSKVFVNRLLENNPVPTLWTINDVRSLDESIIRRMSLAIEMKIPPLASRQRVWKRHMEQAGLDMPEEVLKKLARSEVAPAVVGNAVRFARLSGGNPEDFQFASDSILRAMKGGAALRADSCEELFDPELVAADCDLEALVERICASRRRDFSLCLYGPPGTGKSAFARHLADRLQMPVLHKRASDLLSKYVGENEQNIAAAFAEARESESFLVFDEADSLLRDRTTARSHWEVTQVNEMLTWMEQHPLPFACTTNLKAHLDPAAMRRFTFKIHLDYLTSEQVVLAFRHFFGLSLKLKQAASLVGLTPGDFAVVRKKAAFFETCDRETYVDLLRQEVGSKNESVARAIGFNATCIQRHGGES